MLKYSVYSTVSLVEVLQSLKKEAKTLQNISKIFGKSKSF